MKKIVIQAGFVALLLAGPCFYAQSAFESNKAGTDQQCVRLVRALRKQVTGMKRELEICMKTNPYNECADAARNKTSQVDRRLQSLIQSCSQGQKNNFEASFKEIGRLIGQLRLPAQGAGASDLSKNDVKNAIERITGTGSRKKTYDSIGDLSSLPQQNMESSIPPALAAQAQASQNSVLCAGGGCAQVDAAIRHNAYGVSPALLKAMIVGGEGCSKRLSDDGFGSCGYSQALPSIRAWCGIPGSASQSCSAIQNDVQLDMNCTAKLIKDNGGRCGMDPRGAASCYNSGVPNNCARTTNHYCDRVQGYYNGCK